MATAQPNLPERSWAHYTASSFIEIDGLQTAFRRKGQGDKLLFLHGGGMTRIWLPFLDKLSEQFDVIAPEHPGFGDTPMPDTLDDMMDYVLHYDSLIAALDLEGCHLVAHSLGGWVAAAIAVVYPRRFRSITLITPAGLRPTQRVAPLSPDLFRGDPATENDRIFNGRPGYDEYLSQEGMPQDLLQGYAEATAAARIVWNPRYDRKLDYRLARIRAPTLVIGVEEDRVIPSELVARYRDLIPGARLEVIKGPPGAPSGHLPHIEQSQDVVALIASHLIANS